MTRTVVDWATLVRRAHEYNARHWRYAVAAQRDEKRRFDHLSAEDARIEKCGCGEWVYRTGNRRHHGGTAFHRCGKAWLAEAQPVSRPEPAHLVAARERRAEHIAAQLGLQPQSLRRTLERYGVGA